MDSQPINPYLTPVSIIIAGALIAGAVLWSDAGESSVAVGNDDKASQVGFRKPDKTDHVYGNPKAPITLVEYSDLECPFCSRLHPTLERIVEENNDVKLVYRHLPLTSIHRNAEPAAIASECVAKLGGVDNFWDFISEALNNQTLLGESWYAQKAETYGIDSRAFASCVQDEKIASLVQEDVQEAVGLGGRGTPYVIVVSASGELSPFSGALPYEQVVSIVEDARNN